MMGYTSWDQDKTLFAKIKIFDHIYWPRINLANQEMSNEPKMTSFKKIQDIGHVPNDANCLVSRGHFIGIKNLYHVNKSI